MMVHIGGVETKELMSQILDLLRPGDVLTHCYSGAPNIGGAFTNIVQEGKLLPAALAAKQRGVMFDVGHGGGSFDFTVAEVAIPGGCTPDTISSDIHVFSGNSPGMPLSAERHEQVHRARVYGRAGGGDGNDSAGENHQPRAKNRHAADRRPRRRHDHGAGGRADQFLDTRNNKREGKLLLKPVRTVINGVPFGRPYQAPFAVR